MSEVFPYGLGAGSYGRNALKVLISLVELSALVATSSIRSPGSDPELPLMFFDIPGYGTVA